MRAQVVRMPSSTRQKERGRETRSPRANHYAVVHDGRESVVWNLKSQNLSREGLLENVSYSNCVAFVGAAFFFFAGRGTCVALSHAAKVAGSSLYLLRTIGSSSRTSFIPRLRASLMAAVAVTCFSV